MSFDTKKKENKVLAKPSRKPYFLLVLVLVAVGAFTVMAVLEPPSPARGESLSPRRYDPSEPLHHEDITPLFKDGNIYVDMALVDRSNIVRFHIPDNPVVLWNGNTFPELPVIIYAAPSGRVVAAIAMCEPCNGTTFHIRGDSLVCNRCGTEWRLEDLSGIAGGCVTSPPDIVEYRVEDGKLVLGEATLRYWEPRD